MNKEEMKVTVADLKKETAHLELLVSEAKTKNIDFEQETQRTLANLEVKKKEYDSLIAEITNLEKQRDEVKGTYTSLVENNKAEIEKRTRLTNELTEVDKELAAKKKELADVKNELETSLSTKGSRFEEVQRREEVVERNMSLLTELKIELDRREALLTKREAEIIFDKKMNG